MSAQPRSPPPQLFIFFVFFRASSCVPPWIGSKKWKWRTRTWKSDSNGYAPRELRSAANPDRSSTRLWRHNHLLPPSDLTRKKSLAISISPHRRRRCWWRCCCCSIARYDASLTHVSQCCRISAPCVQYTTRRLRRRQKKKSILPVLQFACRERFYSKASNQSRSFEFAPGFRDPFPANAGGIVVFFIRAKRFFQVWSGDSRDLPPRRTSNVPPRPRTRRPPSRRQGTLPTFLLFRARALPWNNQRRYGPFSSSGIFPVLTPPPPSFRSSR